MPRKIDKKIVKKSPEKLWILIKNTSKNCENATDLCFSENHFDLTKKILRKTMRKKDAKNLTYLAQFLRDI